MFCCASSGKAQRTQCVGDAAARGGGGGDDMLAGDGGAPDGAVCDMVPLAHPVPFMHPLTFPPRPRLENALAARLQPLTAHILLASLRFVRFLRFLTYAQEQL